MKHPERYTVYNSKKQVIIRTDDIKEALAEKEEHKHEGAYVEDRKNKNKHQNPYG